MIIWGATYNTYMYVSTDYNSEIDIKVILGKKIRYSTDELFVESEMCSMQDKYTV